MKFHRLLVLALLITVLLAACSPAAPKEMAALKMALMTGMPADVLQSAKTVQTAYQFAVANPEVLKQIPCYCGCGAVGHTSNYNCYVKGTQGDQITYDLHATGCSTCVDITQDTMRMLREGKTVQAIRQTVDQTYSRFGPSNIK